MSAQRDDPLIANREVPTLRGMGRGRIIIHSDLTEPTFGEEPVEEMIASWDKHNRT